MGVDNQRTYNYIQNALDNHRDGTVKTRLFDAFTEVNSQREGGECNNLSLTAADHYLFTRYMTVLCSPVVASMGSIAVAVYDGLYKAANSALKTIGGPEIIVRAGKCQVSSFSPLVVAWAQTGITDGVADCAGNIWYANATLKAPRSPIPIWHSVLFP